MKETWTMPTWHNKPNASVIECNESEEGETIETKVARITEDNEPINDGAPRIFTERKDGVMPEYDVRTDRFDFALDAMEKVHKSAVAKRAEGIASREPKPAKENSTGETGNE